MESFPNYYRAETCQVYSHNVKEKCIKFPAILGIFWNFGGSLKSQGITKNFTSIFQYLYYYVRNFCNLIGLEQ